MFGHDALRAEQPILLEPKHGKTDLWLIENIIENVFGIHTSYFTIIFGYRFFVVWKNWMNRGGRAVSLFRTGVFRVQVHRAQSRQSGIADPRWFRACSDLVRHVTSLPSFFHNQCMLVLTWIWIEIVYFMTSAYSITSTFLYWVEEVCRMSS